MVSYIPCDLQRVAHKRGVDLVWSSSTCVSVRTGKTVVWKSLSSSVCGHQCEDFKEEGSQELTLTNGLGLWWSGRTQTGVKEQEGQGDDGGFLCPGCRQSI